MKRNVKWTVLAVAVAAATASVANAETVEDILVVDHDITIDDTRNYETNVTNTNTSTTSTTTSTDTSDVSYTDTTDISYTDNFEWNTSIDENYTTNVTEDYSTTVDQSLSESYTIDQTLVTHDEQVNYDENVDIDRNEHNVSVSMTKDLSLTSDIEFSGSPTLSGDIEIDSAAIAVIDNRQSVSGNSGMNDELTNDASIVDDTASNASGNLQFNAAAGDNNVQDNAAALSAADASFAFGLADAEVFVNQQGSGNATTNLGVTNDAAIGGNAFANASGNIGVNVTSGNNNAQKNALAASVATSAYAQSSVSSNQVSTGNTVSNAPKVEEAAETLQFTMSGSVTGTTSASGQGSYAGRGNAYQQDNFYLDTWDGALPHANGEETGHMDMDGDIQNAVDNPYRDGVGGIAFDTDEEGTLDYEEMGMADLEASLSGSIDFATLEVVAAATNTASLSGSAFSGASGNIGVNVSAGTGNQQANSLSMAVAQPSSGGTGGAPTPPTGGE